MTEHKDKGYLLNSTPVYMLDCRDQTGFWNEKDQTPTHTPRIRTRNTNQFFDNFYFDKLLKYKVYGIL